MEPPSLAPQNEQRRPLRTYSKRISSTDSAEPVLKKRRIEATDSITSPQNNATKVTDDANIHEPSTPVLPPLPPKKGTIMSYFKVIALASSSTLPSEPSSEVDALKTTPPSSPLIADTQRRKRRRLTTRAASRSTSEDPKLETRVEGDLESKEPDAANNWSTLPTERTDPMLNACPDTLNQVPTKRKTRSDAGKRGRNTGQGLKSATVQTTLSLSAEEKGFTECKDCNMLYNPLHKQDAKCHAKRHAAMLRAKSSSHDNKTSD
ncbi:hypothetical protein AAE478_010187 [Parahypoxylon ruwenzoriense]